MLSLGFQSLMKLGITTWYELNKDYVADVLCINKDKPELNCKGKCYLNKQLKKADNTESNKQRPPASKKIEITEFLVNNLWAFPTQYSNAPQNIHAGYYTAPISYLYMQKVFHPPSAFRIS